MTCHMYVLFCYWKMCNFSHKNTNFRLACFSHVISTKYINVSFMIRIFDVRKRTLPPYQPLTFSVQNGSKKSVGIFDKLADVLLTLRYRYNNYLCFSRPLEVHKARYYGYIQSCSRSCAMSVSVSNVFPFYVYFLLSCLLYLQPLCCAFRCLTISLCVGQL